MGTDRGFALRRADQWPDRSWTTCYKTIEYALTQSAGCQARLLRARLELRNRLEKYCGCADRATLAT